MRKKTFVIYTGFMCDFWTHCVAHLHIINITRYKQKYNCYTVVKMFHIHPALFSGSADLSGDVVASSGTPFCGRPLGEMGKRHRLSHAALVFRISQELMAFGEIILAIVVAPNQIGSCLFRPFKPPPVLLESTTIHHPINTITLFPEFNPAVTTGGLTKRKLVCTRKPTVLRRRPGIIIGKRKHKNRMLCKGFAI